MYHQWHLYHSLTTNALQNRIYGNTGLKITGLVSNILLQQIDWDEDQDMVSQYLLSA